MGIPHEWQGTHTRRILNVGDSDIEGGYQMSVFKRILLYAGMVISVIMLLIGLAGVIGTWSLNTPVTETILEVLSPINTTLQRVESISHEVVAALTEVSAALDTADQRVQDKGGEITESSIVLEIVSEILGEDVQPKIDEAADSIRGVYDTLGAIEEAIQAFNAVPLVGLEVPGGEEITQLRTGMEETALAVSDSVEELQQKKEETVTEAVDRVTEPLNRINTRVEETRAEMSDFEARFGAASDELTYVQSQVPRWIDILSIVITLILAWLMLSQVAVFVLCLKYLQGKVG
jgi:methyl-accepting chemotaxis protein